MTATIMLKMCIVAVPLLFNILIPTKYLFIRKKRKNSTAAIMSITFICLAISSFGLASLDFNSYPLYYWWACILVGFYPVLLFYQLLCSKD